MKYVLLTLALALIALIVFDVHHKPPAQVKTAPLTVPTPSPTPTPDPRVANLTAFFDKYHCPPVNYLLIPNYVAAADKYRIDYRLLPSVSVQESSCFQHYIRATNNGWGYDSDRTGFVSVQAGVDFLSQQLAEGKFYANKTTAEKLQAWNPNPKYTGEVLNLMSQISLTKQP